MRTREPILTRGRDHWDRVNLPVSEFETRAGRVREAMADEGLDALVVYGRGDRDGDIAYLSNLVHKVPGFPLSLVVTAETVVVLNQRSSRTRPIVERSTWIDDVRFTRDLWSTVTEVLTELAGEGAEVALVGADAMAAADRDAIEGLEAGRSVQVADGFLDGIRATKSGRELDQLRRSGRLLATVAEFLEADVTAPLTERRLEAELDRFARLNGAQDFRVLISNPGRTEAALRPAEDVPIAGDDPVSVYLAVRFEGYWAALARPTSLGGTVPRPSAADDLVEAFEAAGERLRPGGDVGSVVAAVDDDLAGVGLGLDSRYSVVSGIGLELDEWPIGVATQSGGVDIDPGMALELTVAVRTGGTDTIFLGDTAVVTGSGPEFVTR